MTTLNVKGMLVSLPSKIGIGKIESNDGDTCSVSIFKSIISQEIIRLPTAQLSRGYLSPQTRVYVRDERCNFQVGRIADYSIDENKLIDYEVRFPNGVSAHFNEIFLFVRPWMSPDDPAEILANGGAESQFLHDRRKAALSPLLKLRGAAQGMTALISAGIDLVSHQAAAVRRVLTDPVQRYLLADEVGLGKTIEAGLIVRQHLIDNPETRVTVAVPTHLCMQWQRELGTKLRLDQFGNTVEVIAHADLVRVRHSPDILVVDEAHHLVGIEEGGLASAAAKLRVLAKNASVLLLLSATPALGNEARFLALLNLLDPSTHRLDDVEGFRRKLEGRREIGRLLLALDPELPRLALRQLCSRMEVLFPNDPTIREYAANLVTATREAPADLPALCSAIKLHIADSYRIHQRLIRSRRADAENWAFTARGNAEAGNFAFAHVRIEPDCNPWVERLLPALEEWRFTAVENAAGNEKALNEAASRYAGLLGAIAQGQRRLAEWTANAGTQSTFADEQSILHRLALLAEDSEKKNDYATACESTRRLIRSLRGEGRHPKVVAFSSTEEDAKAFHSALLSTLSDCNILLLSGDAKECEAIVAAFISTASSVVLVCGQNGEEGLNLTCADAIVHIDLPMAASRIEQRIGRLDRYGRTLGVVQHRIMLPYDEDDSPWTAWVDFLREGLTIFHRSISDIQFLLEDFELQVFRLLLEQDPDNIKSLSAEVCKKILEERRSQDEQYALDRIALAEEPVEQFLEALETAEEDEAILEKGVDQWLLGVLNINKHPVALPAQDPFKLSATKRTLIPRLPWLEAFNLEQVPALTWRRRIATDHPEAMLLRPGTPLLDLAERFTRWDDRGTAFVTWRTVPDWEKGLWLGFRLCFIIEPDVAISDMFAPGRVELATQRRAQRYFRPRMVNFHVEADGSIVEDQVLRSILAQPYRNANEGMGSDVNLSSRPHVLASVIDPTTFGDLCRLVRDRCRDLLLSHKSISAAIDDATRLAWGDVERRRVRLRQRHSAGDVSAQVEMETIESLLPAIAKPVVKLDAIGCFIISNEPPPADMYA